MWWMGSVLALPLQKFFKIIWFPEKLFIYLQYKEIKVMKNIVLHLLAAIGSFGIAVGLMQGFIQQFISFEDPLNEMAMCVLMLMMGTVFMGVVVGDVKEQLNK